MKLTRKALLKQRDKLADELAGIDRVLAMFDGVTATSNGWGGTRKKKTGRKMTKAERMAISRRMRAMWAAKAKQKRSEQKAS